MCFQKHDHVSTNIVIISNIHLHTYPFRRKTWGTDVEESSIWFISNCFGLEKDRNTKSNMKQISLQFEE